MKTMAAAAALTVGAAFVSVGVAAPAHADDICQKMAQTEGQAGMPPPPDNCEMLPPATKGMLEQIWDDSMAKIKAAFSNGTPCSLPPKIIDTPGQVGGMKTVPQPDGCDPKLPVP